MTRAYLRLDPAFDERKAHYPDGPYAALIATLCLAEHQPQRGWFRNVGYLKALLGKRGRHVGYLIEQGDLVERDGRVYIDGWEEWQEGDWKVSERVSRIRSRKARNGPGNGPSNGGGNGLPLGVSVSGSNSEAVAVQPPAIPTEDDDPEGPAVTFLARHNVILQPHDGYYRHLVMAVERHGIEDVMAELERLAKAGMPAGDIRGWVFGVRDELDRRKRPALRAVEVDEVAAARDRKVVEQMWSRRVAWFQQTGEWDEAWGDPPKREAS